MNTRLKPSKTRPKSVKIRQLEAFSHVAHFILYKVLRKSFFTSLISAVRHPFSRFVHRFHQSKLAELKLKYLLRYKFMIPHLQIA